MRLAVPNREAWLEVTEAVLYEHQSKLETRLGETKARISSLRARLDNPRYVEQAPPAVVEETRSQLEEQEALLGRLSNELDVL